MGGGISGFGGRVVGFGFVFGVDWGTFVFDISDITVVVISGISNGLDSTVGKGNLVRSRDGFTVSGFLGVEVSSGVIVSNSVLESVWLWWLSTMNKAGETNMMISLNQRKNNS